MALKITDNKNSTLVFCDTDNDGDMLIYIENKAGNMVGAWVNQNTLREIKEHIKNHIKNY